MPSSRPSRGSIGRRGFVGVSSGFFGSGLLGSGYFTASSARADEKPTSANEEIRFACIGIGGKGASDAADAARAGKIVAVADVDRNQLKRAEKAFDGAKQYTDFRKLFDEMGKEFDAVTISTTDHTHITAAARAMGMGKHCFCQKPLTKSIAEARILGTLAREKKVATQMGNQGTASPSLRKTAAIIRSGALGPVREVHVWTNRPVWAQGGNRPAEAAVPDHLDWDAWIGPAPMRPYANGYHPFAWRAFWDFGTGALGDMACHTFNMPFMALNLRDPKSVQATTSGHNRETFPKWSIIEFAFPELGGRPPVAVKWYDGGKLPEASLFEGFKGQTVKEGEGADAKQVEKPFKPVASGALVIGEKDVLYAPGDYGQSGFTLKSGATPADASFTQSPGHFQEWVAAIKGGPQAMSNFPDYAGPLTETILLGNLAVWAADSAGAAGKKIEWDPAKLVATNAPEVESVIRPAYRDGWKV